MSTHAVAARGYSSRFGSPCTASGAPRHWRAVSGSASDRGGGKELAADCARKAGRTEAGSGLQPLGPAPEAGLNRRGRGLERTAGLFAEPRLQAPSADPLTRPFSVVRVAPPRVGVS